MSNNGYVMPGVLAPDKPVDILSVFSQGFAEYNDIKARRLQERDRLLIESPLVSGESGWDRAERMWTQACSTVSTAFVQSTVRLAVLVFGRPTAKVFEDGVKSNASYLHARSGKHVDIVMIGHRRDGEFSEADFLSLVDRFERDTRWRYSGDTDVLVFNVKLDPESHDVVPDFSGVVCVTLERLIESGGIKSASGFFEDLIRFASTFNGTDPTWGYSEAVGRREGGHALVQMVIKILPSELKQAFERLKDFSVKDVSVTPR